MSTATNIRVQKQLKIRRIAAYSTAVIAIVNFVSAITPPLRARNVFVHQLLADFVPHTAASVALITSVILLFLTKGLRLGQYNAWLAAIAWIILSMITNFAKGFDYEEILISAVALSFLIANRKYFPAAGNKESVKKGLLFLGSGIGLLVVTSFFSILVHNLRHKHHPYGYMHHAELSAGRVFGIGLPPFHSFFGHAVDIVVPALGATAIGFIAWLIFRPRINELFHESYDHVADRIRVRNLIDEYGGDTLSYFALRDDKRYFFYSHSCVAFTVLGGIALVSPDPIGPYSEHDEVWQEFRVMAEGNGWAVAVVGASEEWLSIYKSDGFRSIYMGDEAIVDITTFDLDGKGMKALRQARNRVANHGYSITFHDPSAMDEKLKNELREVLKQNRRGDEERGFSMTLGRAFDPTDTGLLCAAAFDEKNNAAAFCIFVPSTRINGFSLDIMRRANGEHVNGLIDYVIVETILELQRREYTHLALNFATKRGVLAGERGTGTFKKVEAWFLKKMSHDMQIESLWYFNSKYHPEWKPRYAVFDSPEHLLPSALALARAESIYEIPLIGRFFKAQNSRTYKDHKLGLSRKTK